MYVVPWSVPVLGWVGSILILLSLKACMVSGSCGGVFSPVQKTWRLCFGFIIFKHFPYLFLSVCWLQCGTFKKKLCNKHCCVCVLSFFFFESSGVVTLSWFKAPSGFHFLLFLWHLSRGVYYLHMTNKAKAFLRPFLFPLTFTSRVRQKASGVQTSCVVRDGM